MSPMYEVRVNGKVVASFGHDEKKEAFAFAKKVDAIVVCCSAKRSDLDFRAWDSQGNVIEGIGIYPVGEDVAI